VLKLPSAHPERRLGIQVEYAYNELNKQTRKVRKRKRNKGGKERKLKTAYP
jgi:hypothetical protein